MVKFTSHSLNIVGTVSKYGPVCRHRLAIAHKLKPERQPDFSNDTATQGLDLRSSRDSNDCLNLEIDGPRERGATPHLSLPCAQLLHPITSARFAALHGSRATIDDVDHHSCAAPDRAAFRSAATSTPNTSAYVRCNAEFTTAPSRTYLPLPAAGRHRPHDMPALVHPHTNHGIRPNRCQAPS